MPPPAFTANLQIFLLRNQMNINEFDYDWCKQNYYLIKTTNMTVPAPG